VHCGAPALSPFVARHVHRIAAGGTVLDLACGNGRHALLCRARGHPVVAVDRDTAAVEALAAADPGIEVVRADLEGAPWPLGARTFAAVIVVNYLWRPLLPRIVDAVAPHGVLIYETFAIGNERYGRPRNPDFLLREGELRELAAEQLEVLVYEHGVEGEPPAAVRQRLCAVRRR
jgi:SAM-dependent methyltransferase